jgi:hypothetical protein
MFNNNVFSWEVSNIHGRRSTRNLWIQFSGMPGNAFVLVWFRLFTFSLDVVTINLSIYKICSKDELVIAIWRLILIEFTEHTESMFWTLSCWDLALRSHCGINFMFLAKAC